MTRTVFCRKYQKEMKGLDRPMIPGPVGQDVFENVSEQAWKEWQHKQTMLINERQLNLMSADDRKFLQEQMQKFFNNEDIASIEGYVPPTK